MAAQRAGLERTKQISRHYRALYGACRGALGTSVNPDTIGCVWTGEFDLNTLRVDGEIFESGKKKLRIQKYSDTWGLKLAHFDISKKLFPFLAFLKLQPIIL